MCLCLYEKKEKIRESERCGKPRERKIYFVRFVWLGIKGVGGWGSRVGQNLTLFFFLYKPEASHQRRILHDGRRVGHLEHYKDQIANSERRRKTS